MSCEAKPFELFVCPTFTDILVKRLTRTPIPRIALAVLLLLALAILIIANSIYDFLRWA